MSKDTGQDILRAPDGAEPSATGQPEAENLARKKAADLLSLAAHPRLIAVGTNLVAEDDRSADREAYIGLGWAMVYLADALNGAASGKGDEA